MLVSSVRIAVVAAASSALMVSAGVLLLLSVDLLQAPNTKIAATARKIFFIGCVVGKRNFLWFLKCWIGRKLSVAKCIQKSNNVGHVLITHAAFYR